MALSAYQNKWQILIVAATKQSSSFSIIFMVKVVCRISNILKFGLISEKFLVSLRFSRNSNFSLWNFVLSQACDTSVSRRTEKIGFFKHFMYRHVTCYSLLWLSTFNWKSCLVNVFQNLIVLPGESCLTGWNSWGLSCICWEICLRLQAQPVC